MGEQTITDDQPNPTGLFLNLLSSQPSFLRRASHLTLSRGRRLPAKVAPTQGWTTLPQATSPTWASRIWRPERSQTQLRPLLPQATWRYLLLVGGSCCGIILFTMLLIFFWKGSHSLGDVNDDNSESITNLLASLQNGNQRYTSATNGEDATENSQRADYREPLTNFSKSTRPFW